MSVTRGSMGPNLRRSGSSPAQTEASPMSAAAADPTVATSIPRPTSDKNSRLLPRTLIVVSFSKALRLSF